MTTLSHSPVAVKPEAFIIRAFDQKGQWFIEQVFKGGAKDTQPISAADVSGIESELKASGWKVNPSLSHRGFSARLVGAL